MGIAFDSVSASLQNGASPLTFSFTNTAGNFVVVVLDPSDDATSAVTWNGVAMTKAGSSEAGSGRYTQLWYVHSADTGTHDVVVTGGTDIYARAISFSGVKTQSGAVSGYATSTATSTTPSLTVTTTVDNSFVVMGGQVGASPTAGADTTQPSSGANPQLAGFWYSTVAKATAGALTLNINCGSAAYGLAGFAMAPQGNQTFSTSDTADTDDVVTTVKGITIPVAQTTDTVDTTDTDRVRIGFNNPSKSSSTWTNAQKS